MSRHRSILALVIFATLRAGVARADKAPAAGVAEALFQQARDEMRQGAYEAAWPKLAESQRIDPSNGTLLNLVLCEEKLGKVASAWLHAKELLDRLPSSDDRRPIVERRVTALLARLPKLVVRLSIGAPSETKLTLDGVELGSTSLGIALPVDPGTHRILAVAAGHKDRTTDVSVAEAEEYEFSGEPGEADPAVSRPGGLAEAPAAPPRSAGAEIGARAARTADDRAPLRDVHPAKPSPFPRWVGWSASGVGAAGLLAGAVMGVMALDKLATVHDVCPNKECRDPSGVEAGDQGKQLALGAIVGLSVGAAGLGFGIYVLTRSGADTPGASALPSHRALSGSVVTYGAAF